jgi:hypothetical protein
MRGLLTQSSPRILFLDSARLRQAASLLPPINAALVLTHPAQGDEPYNLWLGDPPVNHRDENQLALFRPDDVRKRKSPDGVTTSRLIFSAYVGTNEELFPLILELHVPPGSVVADVTYGKGIFWKNVPKDKYFLLATDIEDGWIAGIFLTKTAAWTALSSILRIWKVFIVAQRPTWQGLARMLPFAQRIQTANRPMMGRSTMMPSSTFTSKPARRPIASCANMAS